MLRLSILRPLLKGHHFIDLEPAPTCFSNFGSLFNFNADGVRCDCVKKAYNLQIIKGKYAVDPAIHSFTNSILRPIVFTETTRQPGS